jgi:predicted dinucleotide-binding enzyme
MAPDAKLFKAFNQTAFENMAEPTAYATRPVMFVAGGDAAAKPLVMVLATGAGFEAVDAGDLAESRLLESYRDALDRTRPQARPRARFYLHSAT